MVIQPSNGQLFDEHRVLRQGRLPSYLEKTLVIEHDAWIGTGAIILMGCRRIGIGAVVGAGAVLTKDVPDFAVVVGVPARILRYRFPDDVQERLLRSRWWELEPDQALEKGMAELPSTHASGIGYDEILSASKS